MDENNLNPNSSPAPNFTPTGSTRKTLSGPVEVLKTSSVFIRKNENIGFLVKSFVLSSVIALPIVVLLLVLYGVLMLSTVFPTYELPESVDSENNRYNYEYNAEDEYKMLYGEEDMDGMMEETSEEVDSQMPESEVDPMEMDTTMESNEGMEVMDSGFDNPVFDEEAFNQALKNSTNDLNIQYRSNTDNVVSSLSSEEEMSLALENAALRHPMWALLMFILLGILGVVLYSILGVLMWKALLLVYTGKFMSMKDLAQFSWNHAFKMGLLLFGMFVLLVPAYMFFVIPGVILTVKLMFSPLLYVENPERGVGGSLKASWNLTSGYFIPMLGRVLATWILFGLVLLPWVIFTAYLLGNVGAYVFVNCWMMFYMLTYYFELKSIKNMN